MFRWLVKNLPTFLLAFVLAVGVWVTAVTASDPDETQTYPTPIPIEIVGQDPGLVMAGGSNPQKVTVTLRAPQSIWQTLLNGEAQIRAVADLTGMKAGEHVVPIQIQIAARPVRIISANPKSLDISLEPLVTRSLAVNLALRGTPATGFMAGIPILDPSVVVVSGAESIVSRIYQIEASVDLTDARQNISSSLELQAVDSTGAAVSGASILPGTIQATIPIIQQGGYRDLAVKVVTVGNPASGYSLTSVSAFPPIVTVYSADTNTIESMPGYVETSPLDLGGASQDIQKQLSINLPPGVTLIGDQTVMVIVGIAPIQSSRTMSYRPVDLVGLSAGLTAHLSPQTVDVILSGPLPVLDSLVPNDVNVQVDLTGLMPGTYQLTPKVTITNPNVSVESILPGTVEVIISSTVTPTP